MNNRCVCFTTDAGYLFPTLLSAIQAREHLSTNIADVVVILFAQDEMFDKAFAQVCFDKSVLLMVVDNSALRGLTAMYGRLFLNELLPAHYTDILYLDGDVQICASLDAVLTRKLRDGNAFAAVADPMAIEVRQKNSRGVEIHDYFQGLGITSSPEQPYFNSGALRIIRDGWIGVCRDALQVLRDQPDLCLWQDQSALNFAGHSRFEPMSFKWNFPIFFRNCGVEKAISPRVYHFMSKPKPWNGNFRPWNVAFCQPYAALIEEYPSLAHYAAPLPASKRAKYLALQNFKWLQETVVWRWSDRRQAILEFDAAAGF